MLLHGPENVAGMASLLAKAQRKLGLKSYSICYLNKNYSFDADYRFAANSVANRKSFISTLLDAFLRSKVLHFYFGASFLGRNLLDAKILSFLGKKTILIFLGCDIRDKKIRLNNSGYEICKECSLHACSENRNISLQMARNSQNPVFVTTPDLMDELPEANWLPLPIDWEKIEDIELKPNKVKFKIIHAPTDRSKKGTKYIINAIENLKNKFGYEIELKLLERMSQDEIFKEAEESNLAIDQLVCGVYGTFGAEMMGVGLPTIAYINEKYIGKYPKNLPIINANPMTIESVIKHYYENREELKNIGQNSKIFAEQIHSNLSVAKRLESFY